MRLNSLMLKNSVREDLKNIPKSDISFIKKALDTLFNNYNSMYELELINSGKINLLYNNGLTFYALNLRRYRILYTKDANSLIILFIGLKN